VRLNVLGDWQIPRRVLVVTAPWSADDGVALSTGGEVAPSQQEGRGHSQDQRETCHEDHCGDI
jgi:hypothetical protein